MGYEIVNVEKMNINALKSVFFEEKETEWEEVSEGISRQFVGYNEDLMMLKVKFEKGAVGSVHSHVHSQASFVASGKFRIFIHDREKIIQAGDGFFIMPDVEHSAECIEPGILVDVFNPVRKDLL